MFENNKYLDRFKTPIANRLAKGAFWSVVSLSLSKSAEILAYILVARILRNQRFGELSMILSTIAMFKIFTWVWIGTTVTKYVAEFRSIDQAKTSRIVSLTLVTTLLFGFVLALLLFFSSSWIATRFLAAPQLFSGLKISSLALFFGSIAGFQSGILAGYEHFKTVAIVNLMVGILTLPALLMGVHLGGINGAVWGLSLIQIANVILNWLFLKPVLARNEIKIRFAACMQEIKILWEFSFPSFLSGVAVTPIVWLCNAMLANQVNGYAQLGIFNAANQFRNAILFLPMAIGASILPILTNLYQESRLTAYRKVLFYNIVLNFALAGFIALPIIVFASPIMRAYGGDFESGNVALIILAFSAILNSVATIVGQAVASLNKMWWGAGLNIIWGLILIFCTKLLVAQGARGISTAYLVAYVFHFLLITFFTYMQLSKRQWTKATLKTNSVVGEPL